MGCHYLQSMGDIFRHTDNDIFAGAEGITPLLACTRAAPPPCSLCCGWCVSWPDLHWLPPWCKCQRIELLHFMSGFRIEGFVLDNRQPSGGGSLHGDSVADHLFRQT